MDPTVAFVLVLVLAIYFLPTLIAEARSKANTPAIFVLNLFLGWTLLGWILSMVWAFTAEQPQSH